MGTIDTDAMSAKYREAAVRPDDRMLLVSELQGSGQEADLTAPTNCDGLGRIRHFSRSTSDGWVENPLPLDPAARALGLENPLMLRAQVFQNAVCNWRCWYCFVPFSHLGGDPRYSSWRTADDLVEMFAALDDRPLVLDLSGGQPDLVPEWVPWTMDALESRGLADRVYLWSDDNLSNDYFWRFLSEAEQRRVANYRMYGRVCCFKGIDAESFAFNTGASPALFERQFELFERLLDLGLDLYAYVTLTTPSLARMQDRVGAFMDRLQAIDEELPLRTVPLEVQAFSPVEARMNSSRHDAIANQNDGMGYWNHQLSKRFSAPARSRPIFEVSPGHSHAMR